MRKFGVGLAAWVFVVAALVRSPTFAAATPAPQGLHTPAPIDKVCSRAPSRIADFNAAAATFDLRKIAVAADGVVTAYHLCELDARLSLQADEPGVNYLVARQSQYLVVEGRCYGALGDVPRALQAFRDSDKLAEQLAEWQPTSVTLTGRNPDRRPSMYRPAALDIRAADRYEIERVLTRRQSGRPGPAGPRPPPLPEIAEPPTATPSPVPSPTAQP